MRPTATDISPKIGDKVQIKLWTFPYSWVDGEVVEAPYPYTGPEENVKNCLDSGILIWVRYAGGEMMTKSSGNERLRHAS
jgi:hypothetical protein